ncbi:alanine/glycine:cation symporter family protein [Roseimaritima ulvae]|uniref:Amino-acid carrier protein AlsT n=1 Tax=Roseimaritima ulvae TaxID=980254 RepID=A0A5B9QVI4_9BACT|nr:sodium:alanine symporter family protein [Roseimaritima ulvae]QEG43058.1 Amino-acid carrier protein AlsT [Roseimaritima ulvae]
MKPPFASVFLWICVATAGIALFNGRPAMSQTAADPPAAVTDAPLADSNEADSDETEAAVAGEAVEPVAAAIESETAEANSVEPDSDAAVASNWQERVDAFFGDYVVSPIASVIFFDFWTGPWTDSEGVEHSGWLGGSIPFVVAWLLAAGLFLTLRMAFINIRGFWHALRLTAGHYDDPTQPGEVTHFQALSAALSATVGLGNIGGVAVAIGLGGPGATFWMILVGLLGMSTKFAECTLGQLYRTVDERGHVLGGPMRYINSGLTELGLKPLGVALGFIFAVLCIGASFGGGNAYQINQSLAAIRGSVPVIDAYPWIYGLVMSLLVGVVIVGGIRSIGRVAGAIVPFMCAAYMLSALYILITNAGNLPTAVASIFQQAFTMDAGIGGFIGVMVIGIQRAVFSNEAGVGSAPIAHSAAKTDEPVSEGIVALLEPFIDTVLVCTTTALVILVSQAHVDPANAEIIENREGAALTLAAFKAGGHEWFGYLLYVAVVLFAFSTCISWSYYGERCFVQLFGAASSIIYKIIFLIFTFLGSVITATNVLDFSDLMILGMSLPNLLGVFLLSGVVRRALTEYWNKYESGELDRLADEYHAEHDK